MLAEPEINCWAVPANYQKSIAKMCCMFQWIEDALIKQVKLQPRDKGGVTQRYFNVVVGPPFIFYMQHHR